MNQSIDKSNRSSIEESCASDRTQIMKNDALLHHMADMITKIANAKMHNENAHANNGENQNSPIAIEDQSNQQPEEIDVKNKIIEVINGTPEEQWIFEEPRDQEEEPQEVAFQVQPAQQIEQVQNGDTMEEQAEPAQQDIISKKQYVKNDRVLRANAKMAITKKPSHQKRIKLKTRTNPRVQKLRAMSLSNQKKLQEAKPVAVAKTPLKAQARKPREKVTSHPSNPICQSGPGLRSKGKYEQGTIVIKIKCEKAPRQITNNLKKPNTERIIPVKNNKHVAPAIAIKQKNIAQKQPKQKERKPSFQQIDIRIRIPVVTMSISKPKNKQNELNQSQKKISPPIPEQKQKAVAKKVFTPKMLLSKSKQMEVERQIQQKITQQIHKVVQKTNLGALSLLELVRQVYQNGLISQDIYNQFAQSHSPLYTKDFLQKFSIGKLRRFNFKTIQFTPLDHRRLCELLMNLYPSRYVLDYSCLPKDQSYDFICSAYGTTPKEYFEIYSKIDQISDISWWSELLVRQKARIQEGILLREKKEKMAIRTPSEIVSNSKPANIRKDTIKPIDENPKKRVKFV